MTTNRLSWLRRRRHHPSVESLSTYLDGQLAHAERERVERHVAHCTQCQGNLESLRSTVTLLHRMPLVKAPRTFALTEQARRLAAPSPVWAPRFAATLASLVLISSAVVLLWPIAQPTQQQLQTSVRQEQPAPAAQPTPAPFAPLKAAGQETTPEAAARGAPLTPTPQGLTGQPPTLAEPKAPSGTPQPFEAPLSLLRGPAIVALIFSSLALLLLGWRARRRRHQA
ncbi:MAG: zf-HC2 domain-containing protein [Chloroflexi bacterium]|nr:zf-HC2 domain-containing protein [Chloroflexota bacterium]